MKKISLLLSLFLAPSLYAYEVSTEIKKKSVILEYYTGIYCTYCPYAHTTAATIETAHLGDAYIVGIHTGSYATAIGDDPDFRIEEGEALASAFSIYNYPSGTINRHVFSGNSAIINYSDWIKNSKSMLAEDAPLNLWMDATYNGDTQELSVTIEGYYTAQEQEALQYLCVLWTQSGIVGTQSGSSQGSDYVHDHVLRDYITPLWGDTLDTPQYGEYFTKSYTYTLPDSVSNVAVVPEDIEIVAFVAASKSEVLQVAGGKPTYSNYEVSLAATISEPLIPVSTRYGFNFFEAILTSNTTSTITSAAFDVTINSEVQQLVWNGTIAPFGMAYIELPFEAYESKNVNSMEVALVALNDEPIEESAISAVFSSPYATTPTVKIRIKTDSYADENRFLLKDADGEVIQEFGVYESGVSAEYEEIAMLDGDAVYCIEIQDSEGDGVQSPASGYVQIYNDDDTYITQNYSINNFGGRLFFNTTTASGSIETSSESLYTYDVASGTIVLCDSSTPAQTTILSTTGTILLQTTASTLLVTQLPTGIHLLSIIQEGKQTVEKIVIQ